MGRKPVVLLPASQRILAQMGENIQLARLRRGLSVELVSERSGVSRASVWAVEKGSASVAMGIYAQVLLAIGLHEDLLLVAKDDVLGQKLQDLRIKPKRRAPRRPRDE